ncbi:MAG TPA: hypothetical protein VF171_02685, partial [Trueperaceae bacterium]
MRSRPPNPVALLGAVVALLSYAHLPFFAPNWLLFKANRIVAGEPHGLFAVAPGWAWTLLAVWLALASLALLPLPGRSWWLSQLASLGIVGGVLALAAGTHALVAEAPASARVSPEGGVWLMALGAYIAYFGALGEAPAGRWWRLLMIAPGPLLATALIAAGVLSDLGIAREIAGRSADFWAQFARHVALSGSSVLLATAIGSPAAIW